jgi:hypothetical protein
MTHWTDWLGLNFLVHGTLLKVIPGCLYTPMISLKQPVKQCMADALLISSILSNWGSQKKPNCLPKYYEYDLSPFQNNFVLIQLDEILITARLMKFRALGTTASKIG